VNHTLHCLQKVGRIWHQCDIPNIDSDVVPMISLSKRGTEFLFIVDLVLTLSPSQKRGGGVESVFSVMISVVFGKYMY
jgi:hypothetical protein